MTFPEPQWHELRDGVAPYIGERAASLFAYAVADAAGHDAAVTVLRDQLVGEDLQHPQVTEVEQLLIDWGRVIGADAVVADDMTTRLERAFSPRLRETLEAFGRKTADRS